MINDIFFGADNLRICLIQGSFLDVQTKIDFIIKDTLNKKWQKVFCELTEDVFKDLFTSNTHTRKVKCLLWKPKSLNADIVAFVTNMPDGWPTLLNQYFTKYKQGFSRVILSDSKSRFPLYMYEEVRKDNRRLIQVLKDGKKWEFFQVGDLLNFENPDFYKKKRISDRLNNEIIKSYLKSNNIDIDLQDFWKSKESCVLFFTDLSFAAD